MNYLIDQGVERSNTGPRLLVAGLPIVFAALLFVPLTMSDNNSAVASPHHVPRSTVRVAPQPINLASSEGVTSQTALSTNASNPSSSPGNSSTPAFNSNGSASLNTSDNSNGGGRGGGSLPQASLPNLDILPTVNAGTPQLGISVNNKPIATLSGLSLSLN